MHAVDAGRSGDRARDGWLRVPGRAQEGMGSAGAVSCECAGHFQSRGGGRSTIPDRTRRRVNASGPRTGPAMKSRFRRQDSTAALASSSEPEWIRGLNLNTARWSSAAPVKSSASNTAGAAEDQSVRLGSQTMRHSGCTACGSFILHNSMRSSHAAAALSVRHRDRHDPPRGQHDRRHPDAGHRPLAGTAADPAGQDATKPGKKSMVLPSSDLW